MNLLISLELDGGEVGLGREALLLPSTGTEEKVGMPHLPSPLSSLLGYRNKVKEGLETRSPTCSGVELHSKPLNVGVWGSQESSESISSQGHHTRSLTSVTEEPFPPWK